MLFKLAWGNVRRAGRDYLIYLLTLTLGVTIFYAFNTISLQVDVAGINDPDVAYLIERLLGGLTMFLGVVMGFLMVYANNFIMRRRNKEFGLYQVLGMTRGQVARVMALETAFVSGGALALGLLCGVGLSQLMVFFTASLFKTQIANFRFIFSPDALMLTMGCLVTIFLVTLVFNLRVVRRAQLVDLMGSGRKNEAVKTRNQLLSGIICVVGTVCIGVAYARLLRDGLPVTAPSNEIDAAIMQFEVTTGLVTLGTVLFFFGLSGLLVRLLQTLRGVYWRGLNMFTMRQLAAKVNTVSVSMAVISMILFFAITSVTCGMSIVSAMTGAVERVNPVDFSQAVIYNQTEGTASDADGNAYEFRAPTEPVDIVAELAENGIDTSKVADRTCQVDVYHSLTTDQLNNGDKRAFGLLDMSRRTGRELPGGMNGSDADTWGLDVIRESDYNRLMAYTGKQQVDLGGNGYVITCDLGESITEFYDAVMSQGLTFELAGHTLKPAATKVDIEASSLSDSAMGSNSGTVVVPDSVVDDASLALNYSCLDVNYRKDVSVEKGDKLFGFDRESGTIGSEIFDKKGYNIAFWGIGTLRSEMFYQMNSTRGLVSYLAIYIGFVLVVACAAILAIQQLSGVADSSRSYRVLAELGCDDRQISRSVLAQQAVFFLFPLAMGIAHSAVALHVIIKLVRLFGGLTIGGMVNLTCAIFLVAYGGYFVVTYAMSHGIVRDAIRVSRSE